MPEFSYGYITDTLGYSYPRQEEDKYVFRVQINAKMVNFELSPEGYVLSGEAYPRSFTEYWDIGVDITKKCHLLGISSVNTVSEFTS